MSDDDEKYNYDYDLNILKKRIDAHIRFHLESIKTLKNLRTLLDVAGEDFYKRFPSFDVDEDEEVSDFTQLFEDDIKSLQRYNSPGVKSVFINERLYENIIKYYNAKHSMFAWMYELHDPLADSSSDSE